MNNKQKNYLICLMLVGVCIIDKLSSSQGWPFGSQALGWEGGTGSHHYLTLTTIRQSIRFSCLLIIYRHEFTSVPSCRRRPGRGWSPRWSGWARCHAHRPWSAGWSPRRRRRDGGTRMAAGPRTAPVAAFCSSSCATSWEPACNTTRHVLIIIIL